VLQARSQGRLSEEAFVANYHRNNADVNAADIAHLMLLRGIAEGQDRGE
jgi:hypothetical protein